jgi:UDP-glucose 4-epimerase
MSLKQSFVAWVMQHKALFVPGHRAIEWPFFLGYIPLLRDIHPWLDRRESTITYLPINETLRAEGVPMPAEVIASYIEQSPYHVIINRCLCRRARDCQDYSHDIGCLFMGESALQMPPQISRRVDAPEALRHLERALDAGLVPLVGKVRFDNFAFLIPDENKLLSVCFCCPCCCMMSFYRHLPPDRLDGVFPRLEGLTIEVTDACQGCGICARNCYLKAITVENGRAVHSATCRGCGRCARICPNQAVRITLTNPDYQEQVLQRINNRVDFR